MAYDKPLSIKQTDFIIDATRKYNLAHGSVRSGKTVCVVYAFLQAVIVCPGDQIWMIGHTHDSVYHNCVRLILDERSPIFGLFAKICTWMKGDRVLLLGDKKIYCLGAKDEGAIGPIQGKTFDLCYCNEMTLYPENLIQMISTRLSMPHSKLFADMNPVQPTHVCKKWIDLAEKGDPSYYSLHFTIEDNPFLTDEFKEDQKKTLTGLFYRRNYLGEWCLAEGAIFDFFDRNIHVVKRPPRAADYYICGIDYGASYAFACVMVGVNEGKYTQEGGHMWVEREYYYDPKNNKQKTNAEYMRDLNTFFDTYPIQSIYIDPSAASFKTELSRAGFTSIDAYNEVYDGILIMTNLLKEGMLTICASCTNLIREIEGYVWDPKASARGDDKPIKQNDHCCVTADTKILTIDGYKSILYIENSDRAEDILNYNAKTGKVEKDQGLYTQMTRENCEIFELELEDGKILRSTGDHQVMTQRGMVCLHDLTLSDMIVVCNTSFTSKKNSI